MIKMSKELEKIKRILLKYNPTIKKKLDEGLVDSKSIWDLEEVLNQMNKYVPDLEMMDIVLIVEELRKLEKKKMKKLKEESDKDKTL